MAQDANHTLADRRQAKEQVQQATVDGMQTLISFWQPMIQFHCVLLKSYADGLEAMASGISQHKNRLAA
jgi:hypothetical protein